MTAGLRIDGGEVLIDGAFAETDIALDGAGAIEAVGTDRPVPRRFDARGLKVLPGIVDIHGDAFERQMMPRPGVDFPLDVALMDTDRQVVANGITTVFHGVTWSWEPGLRGADNARDILATIERLQPKLAADTRFHLRHETYNLDAEAEISDWLAHRRIGVLAFNGATPRALSVSVLVTFLNIWFVWGLLRTFNRERRFRQTMSALLGVEIILNVLSAPLVPLVDLPETGDPEITLPLFLTFLIGLWGLDVTAFVFARALERPYFLCVAIIVGYALLMLSLQAALLAPGA